MISLKYSHLLSDPSPVSIRGNKSTKEHPFLCALEGNNDAQKLTSNMLPAPPWVREDTQASMQDTSRLTVELKRKETGSNWQQVGLNYHWTTSPWKKAGLDVIHCGRMLFSEYKPPSAVLGSLGDVNCYLIHKMESNGSPYPYNRQESRPAFLEIYGSLIVHACLCVSM